jgi:hypothetical protein
VQPLQAALDRFERAAAHPEPTVARAAFALLARELEAIDAAEAPVLRHEQALRDVEALDAAADGQDPAVAAANVGRNGLAALLSDELVELDAERHAPGYPRLAWAELGHLTASPVLCRELAALRAGRPVPLDGIRDGAAQELARRLQDMTDAFERATQMLDSPVEEEP